MGVEGQNARGLFQTPGNGRNFRRRKRSGDALSRFAEALSLHVNEEDIRTGRCPPDTPLDRGGDPRAAARKIGLQPGSGNGLLQRIRKRLGDQAR